MKCSQSNRKVFPVNENIKKPTSCISPERTIAGLISRNSTVQPFPTAGDLFDNMNLSLAKLGKRVGREGGESVSYIVRTVTWNQIAASFEQHGSAPNFQGGVLTLCTCKHQMRSRKTADEWERDVWVAGFTSRTIKDGNHWLFYLTKVRYAFESHSELWNSISKLTQKAKAAHEHFLGDIFVPKNVGLDGNARHTPNAYIEPVTHAHRQTPSDTTWHNDISYLHAGRSRHPPLLVGDPKHTFIWSKPAIYLDGEHCRDYRKWNSVSEIIANLKEGK